MGYLDTGNDSAVFVGLIVLNFVFGVMAVLSSSVVVLLTKRLPWNAHIMLLHYMSISLVLYDISFVVCIATPAGSESISGIASTVRIASGVALTSYCGLIGFNVFYVIYFRSIFDSLRYSRHIHCSVLFLSCSAGILEIIAVFAGDDNFADIVQRQAYPTLRMSLIAVNFVLVMGSVIMLRQRSSGLVVISAQVKLFFLYSRFHC